MDTKNLSKIKYFGASTSAHQVEGRNHNQWSVWELAHAAELAASAEEKLAGWLPKWEDMKEQAQNPANYVSSVAVDHYNRYEEDLDIAASLNLNAFRFSIEWSRIEPKAGQWDEEALEHYRRVLMAAHKRGLEPFVCLWHWTVPVWFEESGGWTNKANIQHFVRFCEKIAVELGEYLHYIIILNEPNVYCGESFVSGQWPPNKRSLPAAIRVYSNLIRAYKSAYKAMRPINQKFKMGIAQHITYFYLGDSSRLSRLAKRMQDLVWNKWFFNRTEAMQDFIGINYYTSDRLIKGHRDNPNRRQSDMGWSMEPGHIQHVVQEMHREYQKPIVVTENGLADARDEQREWWLKETMKGLAKAVEGGADIVGYLHWSLIDNFEWAYGFWPRFGLIEVDRKDKKLTRKVRPSAKWWAGVLKKVSGTRGQ